MSRVLSGVQPSGQQLHIGNYFGAVRQFIQLQNEHEMFCFIANYHALTTVKDPQLLRQYSLEVALEYLALGLNPEKATLFLQSDIVFHTELAWIFDCLVPMGLLERSHAYKDALANNKPSSVGLFNYPVLMAADILIYRPALVPVGKDQTQHVEMARDIAESFNKIYGEYFPIPQAYIPEDAGIVPGIDGRKMSKSYGNTVNIFAPENEILKKIKGIVTDSKGVEEPKDPTTCTLFHLYQLVAEKSAIENLKAQYISGGIGYGKIKEMLYEAFMHYFKDIRKRYEDLSKNPDYILSVVKEGGKKALPVAEKTMDEVRNLIGIL